MRPDPDTTPLLERETELAALEREVAAATAGRGRVVLITGPAGIGKSQLMHAACRRAVESGMAVLRARGDELEREFGLGVALQLFAGRLRDAAPAERAGLLAGTAGATRELFEGAAPVAAADEPRMFALLHGLHWLTANLAERRPLLLAADDLHWADRPSLRFAVYLAQRIEDLPVLLLGAVRSGEPGAPEDLLRQLKARTRVRELRPCPLTGSAVAEAVRARMPGASDAFAAACARVTRGNPFLVAELLADLASRGVDGPVATPEMVDSQAPATVLNGAVLRIARLPPGAHALALAASVLGDGARLGHAAELAGLDLDAAARAADSLAATEILRPGEPLGFVHPLIRSSISSADRPARRAAAHLRAARLLDRDGAPAEVVGSHLAYAPRDGDPWVVQRLRAAAAAAAAKGASEVALGLLRRAIDEPPPADARADVLIELGEAEVLAGIADGIEHLDEALALISDARRRAALLYRLGWTLQKRGDMEGAVETFARGLRELDGTGEPLARDLEVARLQIAHLGAAILTPGYAESAHREAMPLAEDTRSPRDAAERGLLSIAAMHLLFTSRDHERVIALCERAWAGGELVARDTADSPTVWHVAGALSWSDALDSAERVIEAAFADARRRGSVVTLALAYYSRSWPRYWRGRLSEAAADAQAAVDAWSGEFSMYLPVAAHWLAMSLLELGDLDAAERALDFPDAEQRWGETNMHGALLAAQGAVALSRSRIADAIALLERAGKSLLGAAVSNPAVIPWRRHLGVALDAAGDGKAARALAAETLDLAGRFGAARPLGEALRTAGVIEGGARGLELLQQAVRTMERSPSKLEHAHALVDLGTALRRAGSREEARGALRQGMAMAQGFGAVVLERRAHEELEAAGGRPRRRQLTGADSLTPSERRVADMAAAGMTNREIAEMQFVTVKAVQFHLGNTYRKLGVKDRTALGPHLHAGA